MARKIAVVFLVTNSFLWEGGEHGWILLALQQGKDPCCSAHPFSSSFHQLWAHTPAVKVTLEQPPPVAASSHFTESPEEWL